MAQVFSDDFETYSVPGTNWTAYDNNGYSGLDYWGDNHYTCGPTAGGSAWSIQCARNGGSACGTYDASQDANMDLVTSIDMSGYQDFVVTTSTYYSLTDGSYDYFSTYSSGNGGSSWSGGGPIYGSSGGWTYLVDTHDNASGQWNNFRYRFRFLSDNVVQSGSGVYLDNVIIEGTPRAGGQPNLTSYAPSGWSGPIVPSSVPFTTTTGTLYAGQATYVDWAIRNASITAATSGFWVDYYLDNVYQASDYLSGLTGSTAFTRTDLTLYVSTTGYHTLKLVIDPYNSVAESIEGDNIYERTFYWYPPPYPDLIVQSVTVTPPSPTVSTTTDVAVTIKNQGTVATSYSFATDFYKSRGSAPTIGLAGDATHATSVALNPGTTETFHFYPTSAAATTWNSWVQVDRSDFIEEDTNEGNNISGPIAITWMPGTVSVSGTFVYDDSLLGANRPMRCMRVVLYDTTGTSTAPDSIAETSTDASGHWGPITLPNREPNGAHGLLDLFARAYFTSTRACLGDSVVATTDYHSLPWYFDSPIVTNIANGTYFYGTAEPTTYGQKTAAHLYSTILRGYDYLKAFGTVPPFVYVRWTPGDGFMTGYLSGAIWITGKYSFYSRRFWPDEWDDGVVLHEYGHSLQAPMTLPYTHNPDTISWIASHPDSAPTIPSSAIAFREGRCWYFAGQVLGTAAITNWGDSLGTKTRDTLDVERGIYWDSITNRRVNVNDRGDAWEGTNAGVLWDIADAVDDNPNGDMYDDHLSGRASDVWDVLPNPGDTLIATIHDFYNVYQVRYAPQATQPALLQSLNLLYCEHDLCQLLVEVPEPNPATSVAWGRVLCRPNPFTGITFIGLKVPAWAAAGRSRLAVYDVAGKRVRALVDGQLQAGAHDFAWNGRSDHGQALPPGVYYGRLEGPGTRQTFKMLLLK